LTTVYQQMVDVGRVAVQVLHRLIEARRQGADTAEPTATMLAPELVVRQSSVLPLEPSLPVVTIR
jgi:LacI family transcriptional regulator